MTEKLHIAVSAEPIATIGSFHITNSMLVAAIITIGLSFFAIKTGKNLKETNRPKGIQSSLEAIIESLLSLVSNITGERKSKQIFPFIATFFIFILLGNWFELLPGVGTIYLAGVPLLRPATADLNITLGLALTSVFLTQYLGLKNLGLNYFRKFIDFSNPVNFFIGILEFIAEIAKIISFAFRLFGNIFAGDVLLVVMAFLIPFLAPLPFLGLEVFVGLIQALVFAMLSLVFMNLATISHSEEVN